MLLPGKTDGRVCSRGRGLASSTTHFGSWAEVDTVRIAVALRLGLPICTPHTCRHCGIRVDACAHHRLSSVLRTVGDAIVTQQSITSSTEQWLRQAYHLPSNHQDCQDQMARDQMDLHQSPGPTADHWFGTLLFLIP